MTAITAHSEATDVTSSLLSNIGCRAGVTRAMNLLQLNRWPKQDRRNNRMEIEQGKQAESRHIMDERQFYTEKPETKNITLMCPACHREDNYPIRWIVRTKRNELPRGAGEEDKKRFALARSYMVRVDELVACRKCRKRFELTGQSVVLISSDVPAPNSPDFDPETFGNR
ncbi:MAG: hypothetical protein ACRD4Y_09230, partial [Candidatus Acidiferrales bacterium]